MISCISCSWYWPDVKRVQAEEMLKTSDGNGKPIHPNGAFLVRNSESTDGEFSLSVKYVKIIINIVVLIEYLYDNRPDFSS